MKLFVLLLNPMSTQNNQPKKQGEKARIEVSAGAIAYRRNRKGIAVAMVVDSYGKWTFPKGHVRRGETLVDTAIRECAEETGITGLSYKGKLGKIDIWFRDRFVFKGQLIHKFIHYYLFEASPRARIRIPKSEDGKEKIRHVAWVPVQKMIEKSAYDDLDDVVRKAYYSIQNRFRNQRRRTS